MSEERWVELCVVSSEGEAEIIRTLLESQDIPVLFRSNLTRSLYPSLSQVKIFVPRESLEEALDVLAESQQQDYSTDRGQEKP